MKWIFKTGTHFQSDSEGQKAIVTLEQKRNFSGEMGEDVLLLKKNADWEFTARYQIASIEVKNPESEHKEITITLVLVETFTEEKLLEDYIYSLRRITNYATPIKHFSRKYSRLYDAEFEAIVEDKIYLKRTILGTVLNAMHPDHQKGYISYASMEAPEILTGKTDMDIALALLLQYKEPVSGTPADRGHPSPLILIHTLNLLAQIDCVQLSLKKKGSFNCRGNPTLETGSISDSSQI